MLRGAPLPPSKVMNQLGYAVVASEVISLRAEHTLCAVMNFTPCDQLTVGMNVFLQEDESLGATNMSVKNHSLFADNL